MGFHHLSESDHLYHPSAVLVQNEARLELAYFCRLVEIRVI